MRHTPLFAALLLLAGCPFISESKYEDDVKDYDGDGVVAERFGGDDCRDDDPDIKHCDFDKDGHNTVAAGGDDCDDENAQVYPGADERCNSIDDNCDGLIDDDDTALIDAPLWYIDDDDDGYGDPNNAVQGCEAPINTVDDDRDCDDSTNEIHPGATEFCDDVDRNCDNDLTLGAVDPIDWYTDSDGDGAGAGPSIALACAGPANSSDNDLDCNDDSALVLPGAIEVWYDGLDSDCDGASDFDADGDGHDRMPEGGDCDDLDLDRNPDATEICNGDIDDNCNGVADNDDGTTEEFTQWAYYLDADGDGFGDDLAITHFCPNTNLPGFILLAGDCDDSLESVLPGGIELCNLRDDDCDGVVDDNAIGMNTYYLDADGDGIGGATGVQACEIREGLSIRDDDCNDADSGTYPDAPEVCGDTWRQDCSTLDINDCDSDGYTDEAFGGDDCDDTRADVSPGGNEVCDGADNDCDLLVDADDPTVDLSSIANWFEDADGDGYGGPNLVLPNACAPVPGAAANSDDCDDADSNTYPDALEICDGLDNNCLGDVDEGPILDPPKFYFDADEDGYGNPFIIHAVDCNPPTTGTWVSDNTDCHDALDAVNPLAIEVCDGVDNDCDFLVDEDDPSAQMPFWYRDDDADGYGQTADVMVQCSQPAGFSPISGDCNDFELTANPGASEVCDGGIDNDCDGLGDDADPDLAASTQWYPDTDGDGFGADVAPLAQCIQPAGFVNNSLDCDDTNPTISPAALELCDGGIDNDCNLLSDDLDPGTLNQPLWFADADSDGWGSNIDSVAACLLPVGYLPQSGDCDDAADNTNPAAAEVCDLQDNDCDTLIDDNDPEVVPTIWNADNDADNFGTPTNTLAQCADPGGGWTLDDRDCNDNDPLIHPFGIEICDSADNNCDGAVDDADDDIIDQPDWYADVDGDGYGYENALPTTTCYGAPGTVSNDRDCDDANPTVSPAVLFEFCNGYDDNCNGLVDDDDPTTLADGFDWYPDTDTDGYGDENALPVVACANPPQHVQNNLDCADGQTFINPGASEDCDGIDNDCDGLDDDDDPNLSGGNPYYIDADNDGAGSPTNSIMACSLPTGYSPNDRDCNDVNATINEFAPEVCNGYDDDCDGQVDDLDTDIQGRPLWYRDSDNDGFGTTSLNQESCVQPGGFVANFDDCNDFNDAINPDAVEVCDGDDNDCDLLVDDDDPIVFNTRTFYADGDGDFYGATARGVAEACQAPPGYTPDNRDCDDYDITINPSGFEVCDGVDNDCNALIDDSDPAVFNQPEWHLDADNDGDGSMTVSMLSCTPPVGYIAGPAGDCDDSNPLVYNAAPEICDGVDNNCNFQIDDGDAGVLGQSIWFADGDGDAHGGGTGFLACFQQVASYATHTDCDDANNTVYDGAVEICDGVDNDCNSLTDGNDVNLVGGTVYYGDGDSDGFGDFFTQNTACGFPGGAWTDNADDCNDGDPTVNPIAAEVCDGQDNDCNGFTDEEDPGAVGLGTFYLDADSDGYGGSISTEACFPPFSYGATTGDCDDANANTYPSPFAIEICDGQDNNCNGFVDDADADVVDTTDYFFDNDSDGFGMGFYASLCSAPTGLSTATNNNDCNDFETGVSPVGTEICDGLDNDCDGLFDDQDFPVLGTHTWYRDVDGDSYADETNFAEQCDAPAAGSWFLNFGDCDDSNGAIFPGAFEFCNGVDDDCDGLLNELDPDITGTLTYFLDFDGDGRGGLALTEEACNQPPGYVGNSDDCDDTRADVFIGASEVCDAIDNDCDFQVDDDDVDLLLATAPTWFIDVDNDGYGEPGTVQQSCLAPINGYAFGDDCEAGNAMINPGATEICDGIDNNCDFQVDDFDPFVQGDTYYADLDQDGFGDKNNTVSSCAAPAFFVADNTDCADTNADLYPGQTLTVSNLGASYTSIQSAIIDACDDGVIQVLPGYYPESINYSGKNLVILGLDPSNPPVLDGPSAPTVTAASNEPVGTALENFVVRNLFAGSTDGMGAFIGPNSSLDFTNVSFANLGTGGRGAGLAVFSGQSVLTECDFTDNSAGSSGGAIYAENSDVTIIDSSFRNNSGFEGGHILSGMSGSLTVVGTDFEGSTATQGGGAVHATLVNATLLSCTSVLDGGDAAFYMRGGNSVVNGLDIVDSTNAGITFNNDTALIQTVNATRVDVLNAGGNGMHTSGALMNADITNSSAINGGTNGFDISTDNTNLTNVTAVGNTTGVYMNAAAGSINNSILTDNGTNLFADGGFSGPVTYNFFTDSVDATAWGATNLFGDPLFQTYFFSLPVDAWDLHITEGSPAYNTGDPALLDTNSTLSDMGRHGGPGGDGDWYDDHDGDGMLDGWEFKWFGDLNEDGGSDADGDTLSAYDEFIAGTEPFNPNTDGDATNDFDDAAPLDNGTP